jgi:hypothetical protein
MDFEEALEAIDSAGAMDEENITAIIIEDDRIAYVHIASFMNNIDMDLDKLYMFFMEVQDYEHLIIDIRGNGGGFLGYVIIMIMMLIDEPIQFQYPEFYIESDLTAGYYKDPMSTSGGTLVGKYTAEEFVKERNLPQFNQDDLKLLDSVLLWETEFEPFEGNTPFAGEIWLLVDGGSASASEMAAMISLNTGFATVVGEPTAGVTGVVYTFAALPETGVVFRIDLGYTVDDYGRSFEEFGVIPQIPNMPEIDALETVLIIVNAPDMELDTEIYLDDVKTDVSGAVFKGSTLIPVTSVTDIFESAELTVDDWQLTLEYGETEIILNINSNAVSVNGKSLTMPQALQIINGEIYIPLRFIAETFGYDVDFIDEAVVITSKS